MNELKTLGPTYGTNALFRDFNVDYLVAIDDRIIGEIIESSFPKNRFFVPPEDEQYEPSEYTPYRRRENAGMVAMREAIKKGHTTLYCVGFDFLFDDVEMNMSNIYDGTYAYGPETRATLIDCANRMSYLNWFAGKHSDVEFIFIYPESEIQRNFRTATSPNIKIAFLS